MIIEKDKILNRWVVWKVDGSILKEIFRGNTKKECELFLERVQQNGK